ncbi:Alpha/Beta hydrolase protein [Aspergillus recurvatus]
MILIFFVVFLLPAFCAVIPAPIQKSSAVPPEPTTTEVSPALLTNLTLLSQYSAASSCSENYKSSFAGSPVYCGPEICPLINGAETEILYRFSKIYPGDTAGYIAADHTNALLVISFRNTMTPTNLITDWTYHQVDASAACSGCLAHKGFWSAAAAADKALDEAVTDAKARYPEYELVVTGHSLGGALATLHVVFLRNKGVAADSYTFGAPSVGDYALADYITNGHSSDSGRNYHVTHLNDLFPKILYRASRTPGANWLVPEYSQSGPEYWITSGFGEPVTTADVQVLEGVDNDHGNLGREPGSLRDHLWYLGPTDACLLG